MGGCPERVGRAAIQTVNDIVVQTTSQPMDDWAGWEWRTLHAVFANCSGLDESEGGRDANAVRIVLMCIDAEVMETTLNNVRVFNEYGDRGSSGVDFVLDTRGISRRACMTRRLGKKVFFEVNGLAATVASETKTVSQSLGDTVLDGISSRTDVEVRSEVKEVGRDRDGDDLAK